MGRPAKRPRARAKNVCGLAGDHPGCCDQHELSVASRGSNLRQRVRREGCKMNSSFGPWSTAINTGAHPQLDTFWKRRMAMLPALSQTASRVGRRTILFVVVVAVLALALPTFKRATQLALKGPGLAAADAAQPADTGKDAAAAPHAEKRAA